MQTKDKIKPQHIRFIERVGELMVCMISSVGEQQILKYFFFHFSRRICVSYIAY